MARSVAPRERAPLMAYPCAPEPFHLTLAARAYCAGLRIGLPTGQEPRRPVPDPRRRQRARPCLYAMALDGLRRAAFQRPGGRDVHLRGALPLDRRAALDSVGRARAQRSAGMGAVLAWRHAKADDAASDSNGHGAAGSRDRERVPSVARRARRPPRPGARPRLGAPAWASGRSRASCPARSTSSDVPASRTATARTSDVTRLPVDMLGLRVGNVEWGAFGCGRRRDAALT